MTFLVLCGLGNPGLEYQRTRHNIGFMLLDYMKSALGFSEFSFKFSGELSVGELSQGKVVLFKPGKYMNLSGEPLSSLLSFYKLKLSDLLVVHDDIDLEFARIKIKVGGGSGGHNGIKSIDQLLGQDYARLRFGIGRPQFGDASNYVLSKFSAEQMEKLYKCFEFITSNIEMMLCMADQSRFLSEYSKFISDL